MISIIHVISESKCLESIYMLLSDLTLPKITGTLPYAIKLKIPHRKNRNCPSSHSLLCLAFIRAAQDKHALYKQNIFIKK